MGAELADCYDEYSEALVRFAASQVGWSDAEDVVSAALAGVLAGGTADVLNMRAYLYQAVANAGAKHWRSTSRRQRREHAFQLPIASPGDQGETDETQEALLSALADLSVQQRAVIHLTYWEDLTPSAVANRLGVSDGTVRRQLARARAKLRDVLDVEGVR